MDQYVSVLSLKPTQFSLGMEQINKKTSRMLELKKKKLAKYIHERPIPVVLSPKKEFYLIDHHHLLYACWHIGVKEVSIDVKADLSHTKLSYRKFWTTMVESNWAYLYDQFGEGPRDPLYLPMDIRGLADDPYRSLAWAVREADGYDSTSKTFAEFEWANFFRKSKLLEPRGREGLMKAVPKAIKLARGNPAKDLPGYKGKFAIPEVKFEAVERKIAEEA
jgi:hypothetical protein